MTHRRGQIFLPTCDIFPCNVCSWSIWVIVSVLRWFPLHQCPALGSADRALVLPTGITCAPPPAIPQGTHSGGSRDTFSFGDVVTYTCASGLSLAGDTSLSCSSAGTWSGAVPRCQGTARGVPTASSVSLPQGTTTAVARPALTHGCYLLIYSLQLMSVFKTTQGIYNFFG